MFRLSKEQIAYIKAEHKRIDGILALEPVKGWMGLRIEKLILNTIASVHSAGIVDGEDPVKPVT